MRSQTKRLASGGRIDRSRPLSFTFDGKRYQGYAGDTLASALLANGVRVIGRSFKLHRPRGLLAAGCEEPNAIVQLGEGASFTPNLKATQIELTDGLVAKSVNCWPSARHDLFAFLHHLAPLMPAGFYYKTFKWPSWHVFEPAIRRAAGLGTAPTTSDPDRYEERYEHCDVLVIGGGPAGLTAALAAGRAGARVLLVEQHSALGGALAGEESLIDGEPVERWVASAHAELAATRHVQILTRTTAFGCYDHQLVALCERADGGVRERLWHVRAKQIVLATGAIERPIVFAENDLPGVMLASAAARYALEYGVRAGQRAVIVTSSDSAYEAAEVLRAAGIEIVAVVDTRADPGDASRGLTRLGVTVLAGHMPLRALGRHAVRGLEVQPVRHGAEARGRASVLKLACDLVCVAGGWTPTVHLFSQARGRLRYAADQAALVPAEHPRNFQCVGAAAGHFALADCLTDGANGGNAAARATGAAGGWGRIPVASYAPARVAAFWGAGHVASGKAWVDLQNDVTRGDLELAVRENMTSVEHVKRYTTTGMAVDQGKTSNMNALGILAELTARDLGDVGTTTFRPPFDPVTLGTLAARRRGALYHPLRRTPIDDWHVEQGAVMEDFGGWRRPAWYLRPGLTHEQCVAGEKSAARTAVSLFDGSPLGKIEVHGPDAATFLNRMYYHNMWTLKPGQGRYGIMLNEHGSIIDDGVCLRIAEDHFLVSTTSGGAGRIFTQFEDWLQCEWPSLRVLVTNVTPAWGTIAVAGPRSRELVQGLGTDIDLSRDSFPALAIRSGTLAGVPARIARIGFTGELSFEISVPAGYSLSLWEQLVAHGQALGVKPIGLEALLELRTEKGYLHVGTDTDGRTLPADLGFGSVLEKKAEDFIGRRSLTRPDALRSDRLQFIGIAAEDPTVVLPVGAHLIVDPNRREDSQGYVTSSCASEAVGRSVALGLVGQGRSRLGERIYAYSNHRTWPARLTQPTWYDPKGLRLNA